MPRWRMKKNKDGKMVPVKGGRYSNITKAECDGHKFDSPREADRYQDLQILQRAKVIKNLEVHPRIPIIIGGVQVVYPGGRKMHYEADFRYWDLEHKKEVIEDVKMQSGHRPRDYLIKRALVHTMGLTITEV